MSEFDSKAATWDNDTGRTRAAAVAAAIGEKVPLAEVGDLIEFGTGTGLLSLALDPRPPRALLIDTSKAMRDVVGAKLATAGITEWQVSGLDLTAEDGPSEGFDLVVSLMALHHVADVPALLRRFHRLLRPGGWVALADLDSDAGMFHDAGTHRHHDGFDREMLVDALADAGFRDLEFTTPHVTRKDVGGVERDFPVFLAFARTG